MVPFSPRGEGWSASTILKFTKGGIFFSKNIYLRLHLIVEAGLNSSLTPFVQAELM